VQNVVRGRGIPYLPLPPCRIPPYIRGFFVSAQGGQYRERNFSGKNPGKRVLPPFSKKKFSRKNLKFRIIPLNVKKNFWDFF
jgi:hypothetical protein